MNFKSKIRLLPNFPRDGILYRDITPLLADQDAFPRAIGQMCSAYDMCSVHKVVGIEARGFIVGAAMACMWGIGFIPIRKAGRLPFTTESITYATEYSTDTLEIHTDAIKPGGKVLIVDDLLATGGTAKAAISLVLRLGGEIAGCCFLVEILGLGGREALGNVEIFSLIESGPATRVKW